MEDPYRRELEIAVAAVRKAADRYVSDGNRESEEKANSVAVMRRQMPTMSKPEPKTSSTLSLKNRPTIITGIMEMRILKTYFVPSFRLQYLRHDCLANRSLKIHTISFHRMTKVLSTVATWSKTVKARFDSPSSRPKRA